METKEYFINKVHSKNFMNKGHFFRKVCFELLTFAVFCGLLSCQQQTLSPTEELKLIGLEMDKREHVEYKYTIETFRSFTDDTSYEHGKTYFETNPKDTAFGYKFYAWLSSPVGQAECFYNGDNIFVLEKSVNIARMEPLHKGIYPCLEQSYGAIRLFLTDTLFVSMSDSLTRKDTVLNQQSCVMFSFWADRKLIDTHKKFESSRYKVTLIFRKEDTVPVLYTIYMPTRNGEYIIEEVSFSDYRFDVTYPPSMFDIENIPSYYQWDWNLKPAISIGTKAPDWKLSDINGDNIALTDFQGKYVLLNFWFMGCGACIQSIPVLNELQLQYVDNLRIVGINCFSKNVEAIRQYCLDREMNFMNVWNGNDEVSKMYGINAAPIFYLIDQNGFVVNAQIGFDAQKLKNMIDMVL